MPTIDSPTYHSIHTETVYQDGHIAVIRITKRAGIDKAISHRVLCAGDPAYEVEIPAQPSEQGADAGKI